MTRPKPMPVASYAPELLDWLVRGAAGEVRLRATTPAERARLGQRRIRLQMLKRQMEAESHPLAEGIAAVVIRIEHGDTLVITSRDAGLAELREQSAPGTPAPGANALRPDPLDEFIPEEQEAP